MERVSLWGGVGGLSFHGRRDTVGSGDGFRNLEGRALGALFERRSRDDYGCPRPGRVCGSGGGALVRRPSVKRVSPSLLERQFARLRLGHILGSIVHALGDFSDPSSHLGSHILLGLAQKRNSVDGRRASSRRYGRRRACCCLCAHAILHRVALVVAANRHALVLLNTGGGGAGIITVGHERLFAVDIDFGHCETRHALYRREKDETGCNQRIQGYIWSL